MSDVMLTFYIPFKLVSLLSEGLLQHFSYLIKPYTKNLW